MTGIAEDADAVLEMVGEAARRLHAKEPEHELLEYLKGMDDDTVYASFVERFGKKDVPEHLRGNATNTAWMYGQYLVALRIALGELPTTPPAPVKAEPRTYQEDYDDTPIPF